MERQRTDSDKAVSGIHTGLASVTPIRPRWHGESPAETRDATDSLLATGWFGSFEADFPEDVDLHPMLTGAVEAAFADRGVLLYTDKTCIRGVIDLRSGDIEEDAELVQTMAGLRKGLLARAAISLVAYHDAMGVNSTRPPVGPPTLRGV